MSKIGILVYSFGVSGGIKGLTVIGGDGWCQPNEIRMLKTIR